MPDRSAPMIVLDRDGVINRDSDAFVRSADEWLPLPGSIEAIAGLYRQGYRIWVATNQSGLGRGLFDEHALAAMHAKLERLVADAGGAIEGIVYCPHHPNAGCNCRKPRPGLLEQIEQLTGQRLSGQPIVGDSLRDLQAARAVGGRPILVLTGKGAATAAALPDDDDTEIFPDLAAVAAALDPHGA